MPHNSTPVRPYEEAINAITHGFGAVLGVVAFIYGIGWSTHPPRSAAWLGELVFAASLVLLYSASAIYHAVHLPHYKKKLRLIDHMSIYVLIAGSYTPFLTTALPGPLGTLMLWIIWGLAISGLLFKATLGFRYPKISLLFYIAMGWMVVVIYDAFVTHVPPDSVKLVAIGGLFYTGGTLFFVSKKIPYAHAWWHLCVLCGSASHYMAIRLL
jgi:hemolysin III